MIRVLLVLMFSMMYAVSFSQERKITPVENNDKKSPKPILHYYDRHGNPLDEPVLVLADIDTTRAVESKPVYPKFNSISFGVNIMDAVMEMTGQDYGSYDIWADLSLYNWFFPVVELGFGRAKASPELGNFTYKCSPSFYAKAGFNYNFLYKSNPDYNAFLGLRAGYAGMRYSVDDITVSSGYWDQENRFSIKNQKASAFFGEVVAGVKVKIYKRFSMGWTVRYHFKFKISDGANSSPWYIPGYGPKSDHFSATFSLIYTLPLASKKSATETAADQ